MTTFTARNAEDVLALVPVLIGFEPQDSIVMLTFGGRESFHARVDLPPPDDLEACVDLLLAPARKHGVDAVLFALFSGRDRVVRLTARSLRDRFDAAGVRVLDVIQAHDGRWFAPLGRRGVPREGVAYDVTAHPYRVQAILEGRAFASSRDELVTRLQPDPAAVVAVEAALADLGESLPDGPALRVLLAGHLLAGTVPDDVEAARILLAVHRPSTRDHAWVAMRRDDGAEHVRLWTDLVRRAPDHLVSGAAAVLAFAAWMHGDGALAWCAIDRCPAGRSGHGLAQVVAQALECALPPPDDWEGMLAGMSPSLAPGMSPGMFPGGLAG